MKKILYHPLTILLVSILSLYCIFSLRKNLKRINISRENLRNINNQVRQLKTKVDQKEKQLKQAKKSYSKEKIARNELLLKKPGEYVIQLPELNVDRKQTESSLQSQPIEQWKKLLLE